MSRISYDNCRFVSVANLANGEVSAQTVFHYHQRGELVWAEYRGGGIIFGTLIAKVDVDGCLGMRYQHLNTADELKTGRCRSTPEMLPAGRLRLHEQWQWTSGDGAAGASSVEEIRD